MPELQQEYHLRPQSKGGIQRFRINCKKFCLPGSQQEYHLHLNVKAIQHSGINSKNFHLSELWQECHLRRFKVMAEYNILE